MVLPKEYIGREQAYIKHIILKTYLERLFMIIGQSEVVINYVDCFAGPWSEENEELKDTSIGISIEQMCRSVTALKSQVNKTVTFRALYIEKDKNAFSRLQHFIEKHTDPSVEVECLCGDYTQLLAEISQWAGPFFTFFFVDPMGWKGIIGASTMKPLLERPKSEFLINLMYDFANRATNIERHDADMIELLGIKIPYTGDESAEERQRIFLTQYQRNIKAVYNGRSAYVPINRPGQERVLYFLVYLTRHPKGLIVFKEEAEKMMLAQRITHAEIQLRKQLETAPIHDLFGDDSCAEQCIVATDNRQSAREYLLRRLSKKPLLIDNECWATFLEESNLYPNDFQLAMGELVTKNLVENVDKNVSRRKKHFIKPGWPQQSERWILK